MSNRLIKKILLASAFISGSSMSFAQEAAPAADIPEGYYTILAFGMISILLAIVMGFIIFGTEEGKVTPVKIKKAGLAAKIREKLTGAVPLEREDEVLLEHDFDGIKELDNKVPPWFSYLFYATIIFAVIYMFDYHVFGSGKIMAEEYNEEVEIANLQRAELEKSGVFVTEENVILLTDDAAIQRGHKIFETNCIACHVSGGGGLIGPNLTDDYWIHGGGIKNIFKTIKYGVPAKGMISWQTQLNPKQMQEAASYIMSIHGSNPPNPKAPQGDKYIAEDNVTTASVQ